MYSFLFDQTYINLLILVIIVSLVMFLWRKLIILEGNFFVLEKRVNLIKKDAREDSISRNIEKSDVIMNEIFKDFSSSNACKQSMCGGMPVCVPSENSSDTPDTSYTSYTSCIMHDDENMVQFASHPDVISFANGGNIVIHSTDAADADGDGGTGDGEADGADADTLGVSFVDAKEGDADTDAIDRMVDTIISSSEEYEKKILDDADGDTMSVSSEITFTSDEKKNEKKKYAKMSLDKLKDLCNQGNLNNDGTRNQLITRIIEAKK